MVNKDFRHKYAKEYSKTNLLDTQLIRRLLTYLAPYKYVVFIAIGLLVISKSIEAFIPIYIGSLSQEILQGYTLTPVQKSNLLTYILHAGLQIFLLLLLVYIFDTLNAYLKNWVGQKGVYSFRTQIYRHIQQMPLEFYNKNAVGSLMTRVIHDVDQIDQMFSESVIPLIGSALLFIFICIGLLIVNWKAALLLVVLIPLAYLLTSYFQKYQRICYENVRSIVSAMNAFVQEHLMGASIIRSFGLQEQERKYFEEINEDHRNANVATIKYFSIFFAGIDLIQSLALISVFALIVLSSNPATGFDIKTYFTFSLYIMMLFRPLADLAERYNILQSAMAAAQRVFHVLEQKTEDYSQAENEPVLNEISQIEFQDVWFAYNDENWVLKGFSLNIKKGQKVAIVGVTGSGKTTLLNLLLRFYDVQKGTIKINGIDIHKFSLQTLRKQFSVVLQDPEIFSGTILENITMYNENTPVENIETAIEYANLTPLLNRLPDGIDHYLPERGKSLSAGEQQLISLARAVAYDGSVIVLDEATANIDTATETIIKNALEKILINKTAIIIAHRLSTIKGANKIVVLHQGVVAEEGSHQQLLQRKGIYEKLYRLQYRDNDQ